MMMEEEMYSQICYKKRIKDDALIYIGQAVKHPDRDKWDIDFDFPLADSTNVDHYYAGFVDSKGAVLDVDDSYYEAQLYIKPPVDMGDLPYVTGLVGYTNIYYYGELDGD